MPPLHINWTDAQKTLYGLQQASSNAFGFAFGAAITNYAVSEWILNSKMKEGEERRRAPSYIVSALLFWGLYTANWYSTIAPYVTTGQGETVYYIVVLLIAFLSFVANLAFEWAWNRMTMGRRNNDGQVSNAVTEGTVDTMMDEAASKESLPVSAATPLIGKAADEESLPVPPALGRIAEQAQAKKPRQTVDYINNIKIFLTFIVILHHCAAPFSALPAYLTLTNDMNNWGTIILALFIDTNASYFMGLFFFYSGYFVPKSYDKKGRYNFLFDRVKRLGVPFVVYSFLLGPYLQNGLLHVFFGLDFPSGTSNCGPTWFLNTLMTFSIVYAFACGENWSPKIECPSLLGFFGFSILTGAMTTIVLLFANGTDFFFAVPMFWQDFPTFPIYFFGGAIAQRNNWMDTLRQKSRRAIYSWTVAAFVLNACCKMFYVGRFLGGSTPSTGEFVVIQIIQGIIYKGILQVGICLAVSVFFMDHCNRKYWCTPFFSKAMYTAYIIQFALPMLIAIKLWFVILKATGNVAYRDDTTSVSSMYITNSNLIFPGWLLISAISLLINWPLAYAIRSIPGFSQVL